MFLQVHKEAELTVHVFPGLPPAPGQLCHGEDRSITKPLPDRHQFLDLEHVVVPPPTNFGGSIFMLMSRSIYRRGARRWRKMYKVNGHIFQVLKQFMVIDVFSYTQINPTETNQM